METNSALFVIRQHLHRGFGLGPHTSYALAEEIVEELADAGYKIVKEDDS